MRIYPHIAAICAADRVGRGRAGLRGQVDGELLEWASTTIRSA
jgi:hypothetical protein